MRKTLIFIALCALLDCATASIIYKCEFRHEVSYSQTPCADAQVLNLSDERTVQQKAQADNITQRTAALANTLESQRHVREALVARQQAEATRARPTMPLYEPAPRHIVRRVVWSRPLAVQRSVRR